MDIVHVAVVGAGTMGNGIAQVFAQAGYTVTMIDVAQAQIDRGLANIQKNLARSVEKGRITAEDKDAALGRITASLSLDDAATANLVVEAVVEDAQVKAEVFKHLDTICHDETILASNTSSISITAIAANTRRPEKVVGMHFFNPVPVMKLVEVVRGLATEDSTFKVIVGLAEKLGKTPVEVNDYPGFVSNRLLMPMINEAAYALMEGVATREAIDTVMKLGMNHPMGPLELADLIGLDTCLHIMEVLQEGFADSKYRPCPLLRKMVAAGYLGIKTGKGFYEYPRT
ncbi:MAG: 3-hydroxybutyryl-CoA dehydrogenase [Chloroflexota bacterium]